MFIAPACQSDATDTVKYDDKYTSSNFMEALDGNIESFMEHPIVVSSGENKSSMSRYDLTPELGDTSKTKIYIDIEDSLKLVGVTTPRQILDLVAYDGAVISLINDGFYKDSRIVSEENSRADLKNCAMEALGLDVIAMLSQSNAKKWAKKAIKKAFKAVASKFLGPVGAAIAIIDFSICMAK